MGGDKKDKEKEKEKKQLVPGWPHPETEETTPDQEMLITELLNKVVKNPPEDQPPPQYLLDLNEIDLRITSYKYLVARKWKVDDAEKMWRHSIDYKKQHKLHEINYYPPAYAVRGYDYGKLNEFMGLETRTTGEYERTQQGIAHTYEGVYHKWDKLGHPLWIERTGRTRVKAMYKAFRALAGIGQNPADVCVNYHMYFNEMGSQLCRYNDSTIGNESGRRVLGLVAILDCHALGYHTLYNPILNMLKKNWEVDAEIYPEGLHKMMLVNTPTMITFAWSIVKGWLDPRVRGKILFVKPDKTPETLLEIIDAENLPEFLGGRCICEEEGGCCPSMDEADPSSPLTEKDGMLTEEITVKAGKNETREFAMTVGEEVAWEWEVVDMHVEFSIKYVPHDGSDPEEVVAVEKANTGQGSYTAEKANGRLVLVWSNQHSWLKSKTLRLRCLKLETDEELAAEEEEQKKKEDEEKEKEAPATEAPAAE